MAKSKGATRGSKVPSRKKKNAAKKGATARAAIKDTVRISPTGLQTFLNCRRKWELQQRWLTPTEPVSMVLGLIIHLGIACRVLGEDWESICVAALNRKNMSPEDKAKVWAQGKPLIELWSPPENWVFLKVEDKFETAIPLEKPQGRKKAVSKTTWVGVMDAEIWCNEDLWVVDYKTSQRTPDPEYAMIDDQLLAYLATERLLLQGSGPEPRGVVWASIVVPGLRLKKGENWNEFSDRIKEVIQADPYKTYQNFFIEYRPEQIEEFWEKVRYVVAEIRANRIFRNPGACRYMPCPYRDICLNDRNARIMGYAPKEEEDRPSLDVLMTEGILQGVDGPVTPDDLADANAEWAKIKEAMTPEELAEKLGVSSKTLASWDELDRSPQDEAFRGKIRKIMEGKA